jgi:hypothetical protein
LFKPIGNLVAVLTLLPMIRSPIDVMGESALKAAEAVACPVPPLPIASVPPIVIVPVDVIGPPTVVRPVVPPLTSTLETVPEPIPPGPVGPVLPVGPVTP